MLPAPSSIRPAVPVRRMLVVEDDPDLIPLFVRALRAVDPELCLLWTMDSEAARIVLASRACEAVVADYVIQGHETGWSLVPWCRASTPAIPFGLTSALPLGSIEALGSPFLRKPFSIRQLVAFLDRIVPQQEARRRRVERGQQCGERLDRPLGAREIVVTGRALELRSELAHAR
jgi:DNA-binding response OmpR family regulator